MSGDDLEDLGPSAARPDRTPLPPGRAQVMAEAAATVLLLLIVWAVVVIKTLDP